MSGNVRLPAISQGDLLHDTTEATLPMEKKRLDFEAMGAIPAGWALSKDDPPDGLLALGGAACLIYEEEPGPHPGGMVVAQVPRTKTLLALPDWAVDVPRAKSLVQYASCLEGLRKFCRLTHVKRVPSFNHVVFEFDIPKGESLESWLGEQGSLSEDACRELLRELLQIMTCLHRGPHSLVTLWGLLHPSMVFLGPCGNLASVLPISCLLSYAGAKSCGLTLSDSISKHWLPPEMHKALTTSDRSLIVDASARSAADTFCVAALVLHAMGQVAPNRLHKSEVSLPESAVDLLTKVLFADRRWRMTSADALNHPWMCVEGSLSLKHAMTRRRKMPRPESMEDEIHEW